LFKFKKYEEWGFKNDDQFFFGNVILDGDLDNFQASSHLEETIILAQKFIIKGLIENTGFSLFTIASALDDLSKKIEVSIENPSGRQKPVNLPAIPHDVPVVKDKVHFSATDEDPEMLKVFNTEYHVPEPAILDDNQETFNSEHAIKDSESDEFDSYDDVINDTSSLEILEADLPPLHREKLETLANNRPPIPQEELDREEQANDIAELYKSMAKEVPKARGIVKKPVALNRTSPPETATTPETTPNENAESNSSQEEAVETVSSEPSEVVTEEITETSAPESEGTNMSSESPLFAILEQLESQLTNQRTKIEEHKQRITDKEALLEEARNEVSRLTVELANEIGAKETATSEYEKALTIINQLHN
jgi:hypothetical protein